MQDPFTHDITSEQPEQILGYTKCLQNFFDQIKSMTDFNPDKRYIDSVVLLEKITATLGKNEAILDKARGQLNDLKNTLMEKSELKKETEGKVFFWKDLSGRDFNSTFTLEDANNEEAYNDEDDTSDDGQTIREWAQAAEVGDVWRNNANEITRTK